MIPPDLQRAIRAAFDAGLLSLKPVTPEEMRFINARLRCDSRRKAFSARIAADPITAAEYARRKSAYQKIYMKEWRAGKRRRAA